MITAYTVYRLDTGQPVRWGNNRLANVHVPEGHGLVESIPPEGKWVDPETLEWVDAPEAEPDIETLRAGMHLSPRQLYIGLFTMGWATAEECLSTDIPAAVELAISGLSAGDQALARITWKHMQQVDRLHPLTSVLGAHVGVTPEQMDTFFTTFAGV